MKNIMLALSMMSTPCLAKSLDFLIGQFDDKQHNLFINLDDLDIATNKPNMRLQKEVAQKLEQAAHAFNIAHPDIPFVIISATRNYNYQKGIWSRKWQSLYPKYNNAQQTAVDILRFSSMPGTSRHHWGTDVDITSLDSNYFKHNPKGKILYQWLTTHMSDYGFCQPYTEGRNTGYYPEEWHWSYKPLATNYLKAYKYYLIEAPKQIIEKIDFPGAKKLPLVELIKQYVFSVGDNCV